MKLGFIGLGRMGKAMVLHLLEKGVDVAVYNRTQQKIEELSSEFNNATMQQCNNGKVGKLDKAYEIKELVNQLEPPRIVWLMVPQGKPVDEMISKLADAGLAKGDIVIDGGNSFYKDSIRRYNSLKEKGIGFLDVGTSGGLEGASHGACIMVGGDRAICNRVRPYFRALTGDKGDYTYFGPAGAGHFVKMVHNGIEYGMLQAIGEGFEMLSKGMPVVKPFARGGLANTVAMDLHKIALNWNHGSVVRGWLMELLEKALKADPKLDNIEGQVGGGTTGEWTLQTASELEVSTPVLEKSLEARKKSFTKPTFSGKVIAALRREFGGHEIQITKNK